jgi:multisubunit Na+/H+ antiporter MnhB subunit
MTADPTLVDRTPRTAAWLRLLLWTSVVGIGAALAYLLVEAPARPAYLPRLVRDRLSGNGIANPVTAVVLDFRGYDTLLEIAVLTVAMVGVWSLDRGIGRFGREAAEEREEPVLLAVTRLVAPFAVVVAVYLLWVGSRAPGGAFQAGAVLAGAGVILVTAGFLLPPTASARVVRGLMAAGLFAFAGVGLAMIPITGAFLDYPSTYTLGLVFFVEAALTVSVTTVLLELVVDVTAVPEHDPMLALVDPTGDPLGRAVGLQTQRVAEAAALEPHTGSGSSAQAEQEGSP